MLNVRVNMNALKLLLVTVLTFSGFAWASDVPTSILSVDKKFDSSKLTNFVKTVEPHIREWPPRFQSREQESQIRNATSAVVKEIEALSLGAIRDQDALTNIAHTLAMAHNLDLGTGEKAKITFEQAIALNPENRRTNYLFGMFLISTRAHHFESLPYLEKAYALGERDALYSIGLLLVRKGEKVKGLEALEKYASEHPKSTHTRKVIAAIRDGSLEFREK